MSLVSVITAVIGFALVGEPIITLSHQKQLFLDDYLVKSRTNIKRRIHPAQKYDGNPVLWASESWEPKLGVLYGSVIQDDGKYKVWYKAGMGVGYAESRDGIKWVKPRLDLVKNDGQKTNLLFLKREKFKGPEAYPTFWELFGVHKDEKDPDPSRRYKMGFLSIIRPYEGPRRDPFHPTDRRGLGVAGSPDGIHWKLINAFATEAICDGDTHWMFDAARKKYVLYGRTKKTLPEVESAWSNYDWYKQYHSGRAVARLESTDFLNWDFTEPATAPVVLTADIDDQPGTEIYSMKVFPYESLYIGLVQVFHARPEACYLDVQLAVSHDSLNFTRVADRMPFIPVGPIGSWDRFNHSLANNSPILVGDELRFYYGGRTYRHTPYKGKDTGPKSGGIGFATIKRDRFVSLQASFDGGRILTKPLMLLGSDLHVNAKSEFGEILVEVFDLAGNSIARSRPVRSDSLDVIIDWKRGSLKGLKDPVVLRFTLKNASLFAVWCT
ncbi:MAG TPA: hypothetical protein VMY06_00665 [Sedimentisphaerales bacterium]|nr:hypothetical protein [Sedimentisphaerales bacterium]